MTQEDKQLLLKDLCARLPYHPTVKIYNDSWEGCKKGEFDNTMGFHHVEGFKCDRIEIEPYLRPMSSMTEEERLLFYQNTLQYNEETGYSEYTYKSIDWLNAHHFDYRGLIEKGLAIAVTKENNPYK